ncbi:MAG: DUF4097 family beta strand repeat-containing protein [Microcella sp.]
MAQETWIVSDPTTIDLELVRSVKVGLIGGQVDIVAHDEPGARIEVHGVTGRDLKIALEGDRLVVDHLDKRWTEFLDMFRSYRGSSKAEVSILVPRSAALTFGVVTATALISGLHSDVSVSTVSGDVVVDGVVGDLSVNAVSGEVSVRGHHGDVSAKTVSGDLTVSGEVFRFRGNTVSGDTFVDLHGLPDMVSQKSVSGDLTVRLDAGVPTQYRITTLSGALQLDDARVTGVRGQYEGRFGELHGRFTEVVASTVSGDVSVVHAERVAS